MQIAIALIILIALSLTTIWFLSDRWVYHGGASVNNMKYSLPKHYITPRVPIMIVTDRSYNATGDRILIAYATNSQADAIGAFHLATCQITVRRHCFGKPRVTSIAHIRAYGAHGYDADCDLF